MKHFLLIPLTMLMIFKFCSGQTNETDSLWKIWNNSSIHDTLRLQALYDLAWNFKDIKPDSCIKLAAISLDYSKKIKAKKYEAKALLELGIGESHLSNYSKAEQYYNECIPLFESLGDHVNACIVYTALGNIYYLKSDFPGALAYQQKALKAAGLAKDNYWTAMVLNNTGNIYTTSEDSLKARQYYQRSLKVNELMHDSSLTASALCNIGFTYPNSDPQSLAYYKKALNLFGAETSSNKVTTLNAVGLYYLYHKQHDSAIQYLEQALNIARSIGDEYSEGETYTYIGSVYTDLKKYDSANLYSEKGLEITKQMENLSGSIVALENLYRCNKATGNMSKALKYHEEYKLYSDSVNNDKRRKLITQKEFEFEYGQKEEKLKYEQRRKNAVANNRQITMGIGLILTFLLVVVMFYGYRNKQKANVLLKKQKEEIQNTVTTLKSTQSQLIQSEKMASLGELTAGIAHEIQNPLNFVNNFSDVNQELLAEMKDELDKGNIDDAKAIANDAIENQQKILHHGKRADAIVKGMLQHSRSSSGIKEPTDINKLADEYLRLAYHGLRAKDKSFNAITKTDYGENTGNISVIPQDVGRCILNLITNAFYAVAERKKAAGAEYEPTVSVSTRKVDGRIEIRVKDNGIGIRQDIVDKIFQPFFTTKPAGQGTGLGLSMSYDIITKGHGGELTVETREGEGSQFIIKLPA